MADDFSFDDNGVQRTGRGDEVGGIIYPVVKLDVGGDGATIPVTGTAARGIPVDQCGGASSATLANVAASASSVTLIASSASRKGAVIFNDSSDTLYLKFGATASTTSFTYKVLPYAHWEMMSGLIYTGVIDGIWSGTNGAARTTAL